MDPDSSGSVDPDLSGSVDPDSSGSVDPDSSGSVNPDSFGSWIRIQRYKVKGKAEYNQQFFSFFSLL